MPDSLTTFPSSRPVAYDEDKVWTPDNWTGEVYTPSEWSEPDGVYVSSGGGRFHEQLVVAGNQKIYYEAF